ncbi:hypothetical protein CTAYLR_001953 [Chrysophaeum taylorii]|uniref:Protein kinase domain-containing protein n=1 Tax=Chrysophaeum taylorii TaxID=2483200 RepID=A0AAD7XLA4_9STRA|nr:hypothetical protein CTAYLR_001953 [Chrysophaeum taylorii]
MVTRETSPVDTSVLEDGLGDSEDSSDVDEEEELFQPPQTECVASPQYDDEEGYDVTALQPAIRKSGTKVEPSTLRASHVLGKGAFCEVRANLCSKSEHLVAVKRARTDVVANMHALAERDLRIESMMLASLKPHINIVSYIGWGEDAYGFFIVLDLVPETFHARFSKWQAESQRLPNEAVSRRILTKCWPARCFRRRWDALWARRLGAARDLASALAHLHSNSVMFRDLKPSNLGFRGDILILFDFGLAKVFTGDDGAFVPTPETGSARFMAPEVAKGEKYDHSCDIYSFGLMLWQISRLRMPFVDYNEAIHFQTVVQGGARPKLPARWQSDLKYLISISWAEERKRRPTAIRAYDTLVTILESYGAPRSIDSIRSEIKSC